MNIFRKPVTLANEKKPPLVKYQSNMQRAAFLTLTTQQQRVKFNELNELEAKRITEGLNNEDSIWSLKAALDKKNKSRNRYSNVSPYDASRVKIPVVDEKVFSDYFNASYIRLETSGGLLQNEYIACQGPLGTTRNHFWSMCFHESEKQGNNVIVIVMVTPLIEQGMTKCDKYWPELGEMWDFSAENERDGILYKEMKVVNKNETYGANDDFIVTELEVQSRNKTKKVYHFYYYKWSDAKVPPSIQSLSNLSHHIDKVKKSIGKETGKVKEPVPIVHCSAGVGRSGTFLVYDHLFKDQSRFRDLIMSGAGKKDIIFKAVSQLRDKRMMMVQTVYQYHFLYDAARIMSVLPETIVEEVESA
ncbi:PTP1 [Candida oxycetoniae]|uniref:protein-tyrosine-phosphatase n=1 Tax=Candida oxycetoniae TaxID=497107 RepID=A0AAI9STF2_9ASCO|nr:PTP1 [Candida oxycetoniae]KAI3402306.2 PTP1 [Candida oxycetoniae]